MKKSIILAMILCTTLLLTSCGGTDSDDSKKQDEILTVLDTSEDFSKAEIIVELNTYVESIRDDTFSINERYTDILYDTFYLLDATEDSFMITQGGVYMLEGTYTSTIIIDAGDEDVDLVLLDATITSSNGPAILVLSGDEITISSPADKINLIEDSSNHPIDLEGNDYNAAIYSKSDLVFNGSGTLTVNGNYNNAINSRDDIKIVDLTLNINSVDDGIIGKDYIAIVDAIVTTNTAGDSLISTNDKDANRGFIYIKSGTFDFTTNTDAVSAVNGVIIYNGTFTIDAKEKAIQSNSSIMIGGGTFTIKAGDDAISSESELIIYDGTFTITSGDDALHGYDLVKIEGGYIDIIESYEGIESLVIELNGGTVNVVSSDDGINATIGGGQEHGPQYVSLGGTITITGGVIQINAAGDGIDVNGDATMSGGYLLVYGPTTDMESTIDFDGTFTISGGVVIAIGSDGMLQSLSDTSAQHSLIYADGKTLDIGTTITLTDSYGKKIIEINALRPFEAVVLSSEDMIQGDTYTLDIGDDSFEFTIGSNISTIGSGGNPRTNDGPPRN